MLVLAKEQRLIPACGPLLLALRERGEFLSEGLVAALLDRSLLDRGWWGCRADPSDRGDLNLRSHVELVGIADLLNHHLGKGELILAGALGNHQGPCCLVRIHYLGRRMWVQVAAVQLEGGGTLAGRSAGKGGVAGEHQSGGWW